MASKLRKFWDLLKEAGSEFSNDHATKLSASLAYYTIFSIGPLLLVVITVLGLFYKKTVVTKQVFEQVSGFVGRSGAMQLHSILNNISKQSNSTLFGIIGILVFMFGATGIFTEIQSSINYIWSIKAKPKRSWLKYITDRLLSFLLVIGMGLLLLVSLFLNLVVDVITSKLEHIHQLQRLLGGSNILLLEGANATLLFLVVTFLFTVIYKVLPDAKIWWKDALTGAAFTGILFLIGKFLISYYLGRSKIINTYGAATSVILLLTWIYYSAMILYFGAEFTKVYAMKWGRGITVYDTAVYIIKREAKELPALKHPVREN